jgi:serine O-acetyltransferase
MLISTFGLHAVVVYRFGRWLISGATHPVHRLRLVLFPLYWLLCAFVRIAYDVRLDLSADIGPGLRLWHFGGVQLSNCRLGECCTIHQRVRIKSNGSAAGPSVGDRVWIGPHAQIVGAHRIGSGAIIGAGSVLGRDVPERAVVMGDPARVVANDYDNSALLGLPPQQRIQPR